MSKSVTIVVASDWHSNFKYGLMNPKVVLYDEKETGDLVPYTPNLTASQTYLWELHEKILNEVKRYSGKDEIVLLYLGDPTHGNYFNDELVSTRMGDQIIIATANFEPWVELPNLSTVRFAAGTNLHEFGEGSSTHIIANTLAKEHKNKNIHAVNHGLYSIGDISIDYAHHGPRASIRLWLDTNIATLYLRDRMMREVFAKHKPADIYLRGHAHRKIDVFVQLEEYSSRLIVCPSMCLMSGFARQITQSEYQITNGMVVFKVRDGNIYDLKFITDSLDIRTKEQHGQQK